MHGSGFFSETVQPAKDSRLPVILLDRSFEFDPNVMKPCQCIVSNYNFVANHRAANVVHSHKRTRYPICHV